MAQEAPAAKDAAKPAAPAAAELKVPAGFKAAAGTKANRTPKTGWAQERVHEKTGMTLVYLPAGEFLMGSPGDEKDRFDSETQQRVTLTKGFYLAKHEVTPGQWEAVMGNNPSYCNNAGKDAPVEQVSWDDGQAFIKKLGNGFRLPTEAEWEYACRAGTNGASAGNLDDMAWHSANSAATRQPVGQKMPNAWGLYDMHGNVGEGCADCCGDYPAAAVTAPSGAPAGLVRVLRGGTLYRDASYCRAAYRLWHGPGYRFGDLGCRVAFSPALTGP